MVSLSINLYRTNPSYHANSNYRANSSYRANSNYHLSLVAIPTLHYGLLQRKSR